MAGSLQRLKPILALGCGFKSRSFFGNILYIVAWPYPILYHTQYTVYIFFLYTIYCGRCSGYP